MLKKNDKNQKATVHIQLRFISLMVSLKYIFTNNSKMMLKKYTGVSVLLLFMRLIKLLAVY
jgi:hypothetical protein